MKCWQRTIREEAALTPEPDEALKREAAASMANASVREITRSDAEAIIVRYEWLGNLGSSRWFYGLFSRHPATGVEYLGGVAAFGSTAGTNVASSIAGPTHAREVCTLTRGCCVHWSNENGASFLTARACKQMARDHGKYCFIAYADEDAGEIGQIYKALNWTYIGKGGTDLVQRRADGRIVGSKIISNKTRSFAGRPNPKRATVADIDAWADRMRAEGKTVKGKGIHQYVQFRSRAEAKEELEAEFGAFYPTTAKHR
jgi:hypothetical protein